MSESSEHDRSDTDEGDLEGIPDLRETVRRVQAFVNEMRGLAAPGQAAQDRKNYQRRLRLARIIEKYPTFEIDPERESIDALITYLEDIHDKGLRPVSKTGEEGLEGTPDLVESVRRVYERRNRLARVVNRLNHGRADPEANSLDEIISFLEEEVDEGIDGKARSLYGDSIRRRILLELGAHDALTLAQAVDRLIQRCRTLEGSQTGSVSDSVDQEEPRTVTIYIGHRLRRDDG